MYMSSFICERFTSPAAKFCLFLPLRVRSDNHCRLGTGDSSVAGISINISENIFHSIIDPQRVAPSQ
jgi:hypothetical protein